MINLINLNLKNLNFYLQLQSDLYSEFKNQQINCFITFGFISY